jgi:ATP-dependent DNA helicase PIF1
MQVLTGKASGQQVFIPRVNIDPSEINLPFSFIRRQFPIRVPYCMTLNKGQGQTFDVVGIYLPEPVFSHGQLCVAFSRAKSEGSVKVKVLTTPKQGKLQGKKLRKSVYFQLRLQRSFQLNCCILCEICQEFV